MPGNAALLIDLENFYLGREANVARGEADYEFSADLETLCSEAEQIADDYRLIVRRAYADFNAHRPAANEKYRRDFFLRNIPHLLMEHGVEPIQVFRFPGKGNKNAADMRMAMDATTLCSSPSSVDLFILVTGDSDFIRLALELRRRGGKVAGIGIANHTGAALPRYCDRFEYFEELLVNRDSKHSSDSSAGEFTKIRESLHAILRRTRPLIFARVKPLLDKELGEPFDPKQFGCDSTGVFLRENTGPLGIVVRRTQFDLEVDLPGAGDSKPVGASLHSIAIYRQLLLREWPKIYIKPHEDWLKVTEYVFEYMVNADDKRFVLQELLDAVTTEFDEGDMEDVGKKANSILFLLFKAKCFVGVSTRKPDFNWSVLATLAPGIEDVDDLRRRGHGFAVETLSQRLAKRKHGRPNPDVLAEMLYGADHGDAEREEVRSLLAGM